MRERSISVTEAARNFADCVARVRYQGVSYQLLKNGVPVARLVPESEELVAEALGKQDARRRKRQKQYEEQAKKTAASSDASQSESQAATALPQSRSLQW
ncbi:type II toxin-antitoxin system Phd/YefM family antitoxin [Telmatobacter bradus]|uniref:type II toxin-antitoxin system Phd/YefM family antitoxin n=1 Tax=Telmatobacter bradus TaxID=474953 RepID=UPI003B42EA65